MSWNEFLQMMTGPGINAAVGVLLSFTTDYWPEYDTLDPKYKRVLFYVICFLIPIVATVAAIVTGEFGTWGDWQTTWWPAIVAGMTAAGFGALAHTRKL